MAIHTLEIVSVPVSDQSRAKEFYIDCLGFELLRDDSSIPGMRWVQVAPKGSQVSLTLVTWFDSMPAGSLRGLVFASNDLDADYRHLKSRGVEFDRPPTRQPWGYEAVFHDPDGNTLVLEERSAREPV